LLVVIAIDNAFLFSIFHRDFSIGTKFDHSESIIGGVDELPKQLFLSNRKSFYFDHVISRDPLTE
jgi:hypothetical protein